MFGRNTRKPLKGPTMGAHTVCVYFCGSNVIIGTDTQADTQMDIHRWTDPKSSSCHGRVEFQKVQTHSNLILLPIINADTNRFY